MPTFFKATHKDDCPIHHQMDEPLTFLLHKDNNTMYFCQVMAAPDRDGVLKAVVKEVSSHMNQKHWELIHAMPYQTMFKYLMLSGR